MDAKTLVENGNWNKSNLEIIALGNFVISLLIGVAFPLIAFPWMIVLLLLGLVWRKYDKGTLKFYLSRSAAAAAIALAVFIIVFEAFFKTVYVH
jgi:hypothetical protein